MSNCLSHLTMVSVGLSKRIKAINSNLSNLSAHLPKKSQINAAQSQIDRLNNKVDLLLEHLGLEVKAKESIPAKIVKTKKTKKK